MCNIAGYVGKEDAAPILLEMMRREEGFAGGYYTGIATIDEDGRLHHVKVVGDLAVLLRQTEARRLPGKIGIIHSRSKSGGDAAWAHPFVDKDHQMAYIANGAGGFFASKRDANGVASRLAEEGYVFTSRSATPVGKYPTLQDGSAVHVSEVMCALIHALIKEGLPPAEAMRTAYARFPSEIVGLMLHVADPGALFAARINQPLMIGRNQTGVYAATTALAFPEDVDWIMPAPPLSALVIKPEAVTIWPIELPERVCNIMPWAEGFAAVEKELAGGKPVGFGALKKATASLWPADQVSQKDMMLYEILRSLKQKGLISFETVAVPGVEPQTEVVNFRVRLRQPEEIESGRLG